MDQQNRYESTPLHCGWPACPGGVGGTHVHLFEPHTEDHCLAVHGKGEELQSPQHVSGHEFLVAEELATLQAFRAQVAKPGCLQSREPVAPPKKVSATQTSGRGNFG